MASRTKLSLTINPENVEIWCKRSGFTVITPLEILQKRLGLKEIVERILSSEDGDWVKRAIKKELGKQLIYKNEEERIDIEEKISQLYGVLVYMKENNLDGIDIKYYYKDWRTGKIINDKEYENKYFIGTYFTRLKIIDGEVVSDMYVNAIKDVEPLEYYGVKNTLKRELEKLWT